MAYSIQDYVALIDKYKTSDPAMAYAIYNGVSGMGGNGLMDTGALTTALRNAWGETAARQFVADGTNKYGNTLFDPTTGQWGGMGQAQGMGGTVAGYDPSQFDRNTQGLTSINYTPGTTFPGGTGIGVGADGKTPLNADGSDPSIKPWTGGTTPGGPVRPGTGTGPGGVPTPFQQPGGPGTTPGTTQPGGTTPGTTTPGATTPIGSTPLGSTGAGGTTLPTASAAPWTAPTPGAYTAPTRPGSATTPYDFFNDDGYQFALKEGMDGIQNSAAAKGGLMSGNTLKELTNYKTGVASQFYDDAYNRYNTDRNFSENQYQTDRNFGRGVYTDDRNFGQSQAMDQRDYNNSNRMWDTTFNENQRTDARDFDFMFGKDARDYQTNLDKYNQGFGYQVSKDNLANDWQNRNFDYMVQNGDRSFDAGILQSLMNSGLSATQGSGSLAATLAAILGQNTMTGAGAGAAGTVGGANNINSLISQILGYLNSAATVPTTNPTTRPGG